MKRTLIFLLLLFASQQANAQTDAHIKFANTFIEKVTAHDQKGVIKMMEKVYRTAQLTFLDGNTEQFLNELFGGTDILSEEYVTIKFEDILRIEVAEVVDLGDGSYDYIFRVRDGKRDILSNLKLVGKKKLGFVGAVG